MKSKLYNISILVLSMFIMVFLTVGCSDESATGSAESNDKDITASKEIQVGAKVGQKLPEKVFATMDGEEIALPVLNGKVTVINLWATWCPPCREEMPDLEKFYAKYKDDETVKFYAINLDETNEEINTFIKNKNYTFPILIDDSDGEKSTTMLSTNSIPTTVIVNAEGIVVFRKIGPVTLRELENGIAKAKK